MYTGGVLLDSPVFPHKPGPLCAGMERTGWRRGYREYQHMATEPPGKTVCSHLTDHVLYHVIHILNWVWAIDRELNRTHSKRNSDRTLQSMKILIAIPFIGAQ